MNRPTKSYGEVKAILGNASTAWEKLTGHIRYYYEMDENWAEGKPTHKHFNNLFIKRSGKALLSLHLGYPHYGFVEYMGGQRFRHFDEMPGGVFPSFEFVTSDYVDSVLWSLFGITGFVHGTSEMTPAFGFQYHYGGYYYRALAQGGGDFARIEIAELYDNGNGTYSVLIEYL